jgi:hypothetical protein
MSVRRVIAGLVSVPLALWIGYFGLVAALSILQQFLAGFIDLSMASWTSFLNPAVLLGLESPSGTGGPLDAIFGGPGAPGGTVSRYFVFMGSAFMAAIGYAAWKLLWRWGRSEDDVG